MWCSMYDSLMLFVLIRLFLCSFFFFERTMPWGDSVLQWPLCFQTVRELGPALRASRLKSTAYGKPPTPTTRGLRRSSQLAACIIDRGIFTVCL